MAGKAKPAPAVNDRGEITLTLDGASYLLRPSYTAITEIERLTGRSIVELTNGAGNSMLSLETLGLIAAELIKAGASDEATRHVGAARLSELIYEEGLPRINATITVCLLDASTGGRTIEGNAKTVAK